MKKLLTLLFAVALTLSLSSVSFAQDAGTAPKDDTKKSETKKEKKKKSKKKADDTKKDDSMAK